jgi:steroid 5-alpha reductase family enzyme
VEWLSSLLLPLAINSLVMTVLWLVYRRSQKPEWVDFGWGLSLFIGASVQLYLAGALDWSLGLLPLLLGAFWWGRLSLYLLGRIRSGHGDPRYDVLKTRWGAQFPFKLWGFYQFQAIATVLITWPLSQIPSSPDTFAYLANWFQKTTFVFELPWIFGLIAGLWFLSICGQWLADTQLANWKKQKSQGLVQGSICNTGLWAWSRHPNYFFELLCWFCFALWCTLADPASLGWTAWMSFALMFYFLVFMTGIPASEKRAAATKGQEWLNYCHKTSVLIPWPPKKTSIH